MSIGQLVDIGANLTHRSFDADRASVIARAGLAGVTQLIVTGADLASSQAAVELAKSHPQSLFATAGVHPHHAAAYSPAVDTSIRALAASAEVVAVGECGLDYYRNLSPREAQLAAFAAQLDIAATLGKPVFLHQRDAHEDFLAVLRDTLPRIAKAVAHCFTGTREQAKAYLDMGLYIGITGWLCDERRGQELREAARYIPASQLMLETDAPYLLPRDLPTAAKSRRNEPCNLPHIARTLANLRGCSEAAIARQTTEVSRGFFELPAGPTN
jgi:TatD DNase family protein